MASNYFFRPPFKYLATHLVEADEDFQQDAKALLGLDSDAYLRLTTRLNKADAFVDRESIESIAKEAIGEEDLSKKIASIVYKLGSMLHGADMPVAKAMKTLATAIEEKASGISSEDRPVLSDRIRKLVAEPVGLAKQYKARRLAGATSGDLDKFRVICDIRPVFDTHKETH